MKTNLNVALKNMDDVAMTETIKTMVDGKEVSEEKEIPLKTFCINALMADYQGETVDGNEKLKRYTLAKRIFKAEGEVELSVEEAALLKQLVPKGHTPLVVGQLFELLEG